MPLDRPWHRAQTARGRQQETNAEGVVFEAYGTHRSDVTSLEGLPDVPESRPHSMVNR